MLFLFIVLPFVIQLSYILFDLIAEYRASLPNYNSINTEGSNVTDINAQPAFT